MSWWGERKGGGGGEGPSVLPGRRSGMDFFRWAKRKHRPHIPSPLVSTPARAFAFVVAGSRYISARGFQFNSLCVNAVRNAKWRTLVVGLGHLAQRLHPFQRLQRGHQRQLDGTLRCLATNCLLQAAAAALTTEGRQPGCPLRG